VFYGDVEKTDRAASTYDLSSHPSVRQNNLTWHALALIQSRDYGGSSNIRKVSGSYSHVCASNTSALLHYEIRDHVEQWLKIRDRRQSTFQTIQLLNDRPYPVDQN
jgi:hypothetical protein